jgi:hypothetical protein
MQFPDLDPLSQYTLALAKMVASTSWLPHKDTVGALDGAVFPTVRSIAKRGQHVKNGQTIVGMYDDNATPAWALSWAHGLTGKRPKGWTVAHVWPLSADITGYTHLANLALVPECFQSLTDKNGPLTVFLRWHAWVQYGWSPRPEIQLAKPDSFDAVEWRYLPPQSGPAELIRERMRHSREKRVGTLRDLLGRNAAT